MGIRFLRTTQATIYDFLEMDSINTKTPALILGETLGS